MGCDVGLVWGVIATDDTGDDCMECCGVGALLFLVVGLLLLVVFCYVLVVFCYGLLLLTVVVFISDN